MRKEDEARALRGDEDISYTDARQAGKEFAEAIDEYVRLNPLTCCRVGCRGYAIAGVWFMVKHEGNSPNIHSVVACIDHYQELMATTATGPEFIIQR